MVGLICLSGQLAATQAAAQEHGSNVAKLRVIPQEMQKLVDNLLLAFGQSIDDLEMLKLLQEGIDHHSLLPSDILLEITESCAINKLEEAHQFINAMKEHPESIKFMRKIKRIVSCFTFKNFNICINKIFNRFLGR